MIKKLRKICNEQCLCEIYHDVEQTTKFGVGRVLSCDKKNVVACRIDPYGHYDGIGWKNIDSIIRIVTNSKYLKACNKLIEHDSESTERFHQMKEEGLDLHLQDIFLTFALSNNRICEIELCESELNDISGYILGLSENTVEIRSISEYGEFDGDVIIDKNMISSIIVDSADTRKLEILSGK